MHTDPFLPSRSRASRNALQMRERVGRSIIHIAERAAPTLNCNFADKIQERLADAAAHPYLAPALFALYHASLVAVETGQLTRLARLLAAVAADSWGRDHREIVDLSAEELNPLVLELSRNALEVDASTNVSVGSPTPESSRTVREWIGEALASLRRCSPDLADEVDSILSQIILVSEGNGTGSATFAGGSSFHLWGAIFLNTKAFADCTDLLIGIVHEVAHLVLFAEALEEPLVLNHPSEIYPSPLRRELRPMDGIYHATYVTARMHLAAVSLARDNNPSVLSRNLSPRFEKLFWAGLATIRKHGRLTETGQSLMGAAVEYMRTASSSHPPRDPQEQVLPTSLGGRRDNLKQIS